METENIEDERSRKEEYENLLDEATGLLDAEGEHFDDIHRIIGSADKLARDNPQSDEVALDARILSTASSYLLKFSEPINDDEDDFDDDECAVRFLSSLESFGTVSNNRPVAWDRLIPEITKCFRLVPSFHFALGTFTTESVPVTSRKQRKPKENQEGQRVTKKLGEVAASQEKEEDGIEKKVQYILKVVRKEYSTHNRPVNFFQLVSDPSSYENTVNNLYHFSFLVRDGAVDMKLDETGTSVVIPVSKAIQESRKTSSEPREQMLLTINRERWEKIIRQHNIVKPLLKIGPEK